MFGKLTVHSIPYEDPIIMSTIVMIFIAGVIMTGMITYYNQWKYLWCEWLTSVDHKKIGIMYIIISCIMFLRGFTDAIMMRTQQTLSSIGSSEFLSPHHYDQVVTAHGVIMIIFMATPFVIGLMNLIVPLQIGARDVAFPFLNSLSFWLFMVGVILINLSLGIGEFAQTGWAAYPPLSSKIYSPDVGVDYWIWSIQISGIGTTLTGINFFTTILYMRAPGMLMMKMPVFTWTALCTNALIIIAFPILTVTIALLTFDRYLDTHFFTNDLGGNMMMYINLFWAWGHPEVYILVLPAFGIFSEVVSTFSQKQIFGYTALVWATIAITALSFCVWLHHFFTMGAGANVNAFFGIMTMIIAIPTGVKIFNWLFTMYRGKIIFQSPMLWVIGFIVTFSIGGMTGVLLAVPGADFILHNSLFLVAHFHNVIIGGVLFGCFSGISYWFPKAFGYTLDETWGKRAFWFWIIGFYVAFMPLYILGFMGMTRRLSQQIDTEFSPMLITAAVGTILIGCGIICQCLQLIISIRNRHHNLDKTGNPWNGFTLEWSTSSPPPFYNFVNIPIINNHRNIFWYIKNNKNISCNIKKYQPIHMPKNTHEGILIAFFSLIFGFSMIWYIWWSAILGFFGIIITWIARSFNTNTEYYITPKEIKEIEYNAYNK
ncbi:cytochrome o ubiquinol oxidase subunit I [Candidatus Blochmanniella floridana]|uniref:Cytochrome bo(3) ubiquinol oxidase subunit 1 n=1 Tax=Blochmanniella floridana TaxID=203907 RepID=Q7VRH3_BLOFL|nr:cytochrome o ubiquinol oxidase subunit I [Candidatus Blochmannia floridanus]